jgi:hypothetical protein
MLLWFADTQKLVIKPSSSSAYVMSVAETTSFFESSAPQALDYLYIEAAMSAMPPLSPVSPAPLARGTYLPTSELLVLDRSGQLWCQKVRPGQCEPPALLCTIDNIAKYKASERIGSVFVHDRFAVIKTDKLWVYSVDSGRCLYTSFADDEVIVRWLIALLMTGVQVWQSWWGQLPLTGVWSDAGLFVLRTPDVLQRAREIASSPAKPGTNVCVYVCVYVRLCVRGGYLFVSCARALRPFLHACKGTSEFDGFNNKNIHLAHVSPPHSPTLMPAVCV